MVVVWILSGFLLRALNSGEVLGGTSMEGIELGGETQAQAARLIKDLAPRQTVLSGGGSEFRIRAPQAGLTVDEDASADRAYEAGRSGVLAFLGGPVPFLSSREVDPVFAPVNEGRLRRTVGRIADRLDRPPFVGALSIDPATLEVTTEEPEAGLLVRRPVTQERLVDTLEADDPSMRIPMRTEPAPTLEEVDAVAADAERYLREPVGVKTAGGPAELSPEQIAGVLAIEPSGTGIHLGADKAEVEALVAGFADGRDIETRDASIEAPARPPVTLSEQGDLSWSPKPGAATVTPDRRGREIQQGKSVQNLMVAVREGRHFVRFPSEFVAPEVTTREMRGANSLLGTFTTNYSCCEPRVTNIQQMAETVDGTVIGPGEQFSLNTVAGERTRANGYKPAPTIGEGNELIDTVGGGVSQFSTTLYNAAYFAGLQIDSHTPHSFYIDRYPAGRESTLNYGSIDLLWTNDTDTPVVVRSSADDTSVTVSIYGGNGGRRVRAETQSRSGNGQGGFDITVDRVIVKPDGSREREPFTTSYGVPAE